MRKLLRLSIRWECLSRLKSCPYLVVVQELPGILLGGWPTLR